MGQYEVVGEPIGHKETEAQADRLRIDFRQSLHVR